MGARRPVFDDSLAAPGFLKTGRDSAATLSSEQRAALVRRGNELFNRGAIEQAKRIFLTAHYTDGIVRVGDHYLRQKQPLEAFRMYWLAPERTRSEQLIARMATVIRDWLREAGDE